MLFKTITKDSFRRFVNKIIEKNQTIAPKAVDKDASGKNIYQFEEVLSFDEIELDYDIAESSIKRYFLPFRETLSTFNFENNDWQQDIKYRVNPRVIIGLRAHDVNGLLKLDKVLMRGYYPSPYYISRRKNTLIIGMNHSPDENNFSRSLNTDEVTHGFDVFLTDIGDKYFLEINSNKIFNMLKNIETKDISNEDEANFIKEKKRIAGEFQTSVDIAGLPSLMDIEFESEVWKKWGDKCLSCGSCAMVCPTCYCYTVNENIDTSLKRTTKERQLYSCNLKDFAEVAGGHNFRPKAESRLKYRFYHQHRGFVESYDEPLCVGCNRCGRACPAGINPIDVINDLLKEER